MRKIYKYPLSILEVQVINLPANAEILTVQVQESEVGFTESYKLKELMLWAVVNTELDTNQERIIRIIGTGNPIPNVVLKYISTVQINNFVWHIFEEI